MCDVPRSALPGVASTVDVVGAAASGVDEGGETNESTLDRSDVHAGAGESSAAQVVTKGTVSLAFSGTGKGVDLGVTFGEFVITKQSSKKKGK